MMDYDSQFGTVDLSTGMFTSVGTLGAPNALGSLGEYNGIVYTASYHTQPNTVFEVNTTNASLTALATSDVDYFGLGSMLTGLYAVDTNHNLYSINPSTGAPTLIGPTGLTHGSAEGMSTGSSVLYYTDNSSLYSINTATGAATLIGSTGGASYDGLVTVNGTLYGGQTLPDSEIDTLNPATGAATTGPAIMGANSFEYGLAPVLPVPEPSTLALLGVGTIALTAVGVRPKVSAMANWRRSAEFAAHCKVGPEPRAGCRVDKWGRECDSERRRS
jgi:hypothetical protein